jgi:DNA-3-methyladenine glycosylase I
VTQTYCDVAPGHEWHGPYHEREYGFPLETDAELFERLVLEINQAGLSWLTILKKREAFRQAYDGFDPDVVAHYGDADRTRLLANPGIIRNRLKVDAAISNAQRIIELRHTHGSFAGWLSAHHPRGKDDWVRLFKKTFRFTGGEIVGEFLMSIGYLPGAHVATCPVYPVILARRPAWLYEKRQVSGPFGSLAVDDGGLIVDRGLPVVLVHSLAGNSAQWSAQLDHLRRNRRAVALDLRGHGQSEAPRNGDYSIAAMAGDVGAVVDSLRLDEFVLVGHSMGGGVALAYAGAHPERVAGLLLVDPIGDGKQIPPAEAKSYLSGFESDYDSTSQAYWTSIAGPDTVISKRLLADLAATSREVVVRVLREVMQFDPDPALARYNGPKLSIVTPHNDMPSSLHRLGKGFPHRMVEGTGHWIQLDRPAVVNRLIDEFLNSNSVSGK